jgi:asparagine synthase (glutamine-hydrolysing)
LLQVTDINAELDPQALHQYLTFLWVPDPKTMFRRVRKLPAGHFATLQNGRLNIKRYWDLSFPPAAHRYRVSEADLAAEVRERFRLSVKAQMVSDVPIGAFLSAGLDSSSIVAMMRQATAQPLQTYTITFPKKYRVGENTLDNPDVATRLARHLGCENHRITVEPDVTELLPKLVWHMDEPTADPAIITAFLVCREARKQATVLLSGIGGDELFAGYRKHVAHYWSELYSHVPSLLRQAAERALDKLPVMRGTALKGALRLAKKMARSASLARTDRFIANCTYLDGKQKTQLYTSALAAEAITVDPACEHVAAFDRVHDADFLHQMLYLDTKIFMTTLNLTYNDKMSMASSVEVRLPFLDRELAEFVAREVPPGLKLKGILRPSTKYIFRQAMRDILPHEVLRQRKAGFAAPVDYWLAHDVRQMVDDLLSLAQVRKRGLFRPEAIQRFVHEHRSGRRDWSMQIWQLLTFELWMQVFLDGGSSRFEAEALPRQTATA